MSRPAISETLSRVREMTRQARERLASKLLALEVVHEAMSAAAAEGFNTVTIAPDKPVDLSQTAIAAETVEALKAEGLRVEWEPRTRPDAPSWKVMVVTWS